MSEALFQRRIQSARDAGDDRRPQRLGQDLPDPGSRGGAAGSRGRGALHPPALAEPARRVRPRGRAGLRGRGLACLVAADRHQQVEGEIAAHLGAGEIVLCDRYIESSLVLQRLDWVETEFIVAINAGITRPDLRIRLLRRAGDDPRRGWRRARPTQAGGFEQSAGPELELELYEEADRFLPKDDYGLAARSSSTRPRPTPRSWAGGRRAIVQDGGPLMAEEALSILP